MYVRLMHDYPDLGFPIGASSNLYIARELKPHPLIAYRKMQARPCRTILRLGSAEKPWRLQWRQTVYMLSPRHAV